MCTLKHFKVTTTNAKIPDINAILEPYYFQFCLAIPILFENMHGIKPKSNFTTLLLCRDFFTSDKIHEKILSKIQISCCILKKYVSNSLVEVYSLQLTQNFGVSRSKNIFFQKCGSLQNELLNFMSILFHFTKKRLQNVLTIDFIKPVYNAFFMSMKLPK